MYRSVFPPLCLILALAMAIVGFSMIAFGGPEAGLALHQARASGDDLSSTTLEEDLEERQTTRMMTIVLLLVGSGVMTVVAFSSMRGATPSRN